MRLVPALTVCWLTGCVGDISTPSALPNEPITTVEQAPQPATGFTLPDQDVQLLPFQVRFARLQAVTGAGPQDPMFEKLLESRTSLGDYDFANGIKPDNSWTALRITQWVAAMKPVCASAQFQQRFPDSAAAIAPFIEAAYGRAATTEDFAAIEGALGGLQISAADRRDGICVAVLSSMEFIAL